MLGAYRGKIVQSKINSFRKPSEEKTLHEQTKPMNRSQVKRPQPSVSVPAKTTVRPSIDIEPKRPVIPPVSSQIRPSSTLIKSKSEPANARRTTQVLTQQKTQPAKPPLKNGAVKNIPAMQSAKSSSRPVKMLPEPQKTKPAPQPPTASKFTRTKASAAELKARLEEWRQSKGKVSKRPQMGLVLPSTCTMHEEEPESETEPEEPKEKPRQLYWAPLPEEDERELFTLKVQQIFDSCKKLIDEGHPREECLSLLEKQIQIFPEAKKLSGYWECLEKRDGQLYKVIAVSEEAVSTGAQPLGELRAIRADALEQLKPDPVESERKVSEDSLVSEELKTKVNDEPVDDTGKEKRRRGKRAVKLEPQSLISSVIKFNVRLTPDSEKMKKLQMNEGESSIKSYKFLTPVRRSSRLECKSHRLPDMLKDHDPCVSSIHQMEDTETCSNAYIFRKNCALNEVAARSAYQACGFGVVESESD